MIKIEKPSGEVIETSQSCQSDQLLSDWLTQSKIPLNMRCGGRGLCKGCQVELNTSSSSELRRSCQLMGNEIPDDLSFVRIPLNSWHDRSLHGVSAFEVRASELDIPSRDGYGLAIDVGTTTVAVNLWDFSKKISLGTKSSANAQARFGDNVLSRIHFAIENEEGSSQLQRSLVDGTLTPLIRDLCKEADLELHAITEATVAGNTVMLHSLVAAPLDGFGKYPFRPEFLDTKIIGSGDIELPGNFKLALLPGLGPFVGADIAAGAVAAGIHEKEGSVLLIDFGTNGEILLKHEGKYLATATAAGPAFEGGRLNCGAAARDGVVSSVSRDNSRWLPVLHGDPQATASGISGAAYIDLLALGLRDGLLNEFGRFDRHVPEVESFSVDDEIEYRIPISKELFFSEVDVAELLQAKAAIGAGVNTLLELADIDADDLETVFIAGGFGYHLNPLHARAIGLLPDVSLNRFEIIGNASLAGASLLMHEPYRAGLSVITENCEIIELNQIDSFEDHYIDALRLSRE